MPSHATSAVLVPFGTAIRHGSTSAGVLFGFAATGLDEDGPREPTEVGELQDALERAVALDPELTPAYLLLVALAIHREDLDAANDWLQKGLAVDPHSGELRLQLALSHVRSGRTDYARTTLQRVLASGDPELTARANELLGQLPTP